MPRAAPAARETKANNEATGREGADAGSGAVPILERLGAKIRSRRQALSLTLRELSQRSGLSERFLVLLESGRANVSVVRLVDVASALGATASEMLADADKGAEAPLSAADTRGRLIALLGLRGAGKTAIGERAAARLGLPFIELDALIAERAGMSLSEIFELHGGAYYRKLEREELERLFREGARGVLATGGGLVTDHATFARLRSAAVTIWLRASAEDHWNRVIAQGDGRPMANRTSAMKELRALLRARRALYERCDHVVDTSALGLARAVDRVVKLTRDAVSTKAASSA